jgi:hypothetical protein
MIGILARPADSSTVRLHQLCEDVEGAALTFFLQRMSPELGRNTRSRRKPTLGRWTAIRVLTRTGSGMCTAAVEGDRLISYSITP